MENTKKRIGDFLSAKPCNGIDWRLIASYFFLALAIFADNGAFDPPILIPLLISFALLMYAVIRPQMQSIGVYVLVSALILSWGLTLIRPPSFGEDAVLAHPAFPFPPLVAYIFYFALTFGTLVVVIYGILRKTRILQLWILLVLFFCAGILNIIFVLAPYIDVHWLQQAGAQSLMNGENPYGMVIPNQYSPDESQMFFGDERIVLDNYPYPPISLLVSTIGWMIAGDVRWSFLTVHLACAVFIWLLARRRGHPDSSALGLAGIWLLHPRGLFVLEMSWTEPLMCLAWVWLLWAMSGRSKSRVAAIALGLFLSAKQHSVLLLPWLMKRRENKTIFSGCILAALTLLPFAVWNLRDFFEDIVLFQFFQPFRTDALGIPAFVAWATGWEMPSWLSLIAWAAGVSWIYHLGKIRAEADTVRAWAVISSVSYFILFIFAKQAFCNYYYFVGALLVALAATGKQIKNDPPSKIGI